MDGNLEFEALFNSFDRSNEIEFRKMFTPLTQQNFKEILTTTNASFGDNFILKKSQANHLIKGDHLNGSVTYYFYFN
ncbi:UNVERIFIED_CONTAM: hypothetical protein O8I53_13515 [Campylobacter lari]